MNILKKIKRTKLCNFIGKRILWNAEDNKDQVIKYSSEQFKDTIFPGYTVIVGIAVLKNQEMECPPVPYMMPYETKSFSQ